MRSNLALPGLSVAILFATALFLAGCNRDDGNAGANASAPATLGEPVEGEVPTVCANCLTEEKLGETVAVEGEIIQQCPASGCWFRVKDDAGVAFVDLAPAKLRLTEKREGRHARVTGRVAKQGAQFRLEARHIQFKAAKKDGRLTDK